MTRKTWNVRGMSCQHCVTAVRQAAGSVPGVTRVEVSLEQGVVSFEYPEGSEAPASVKQAIEAQGYEVLDGGVIGIPRLGRK